jgi:hypothetical protein
MSVLHVSFKNATPLLSAAGNDMHYICLDVVFSTEIHWFFSHSSIV